MKKIILTIIFALNTFLLFSDVDFANFIGYLPIDCNQSGDKSIELSLYDQPGYFQNIPVIKSYNCNQTFQILDVSSFAYIRNDIDSPFYKILTPEGDEKWVPGTSLIIVSNNYEITKSWYKTFRLGMQIYKRDDGFHLIESSSSSNKFQQRGKGSNTILSYNYMDDGSKYSYSWDSSTGRINRGFKSTGKQEFTYSLLKENYDNLSVERILPKDEEEFWYYYFSNDFNNIQLLTDLSKYKSQYVSKKVSPLIKGINDRNFKMIKFLLENGFSKTYGSGIYDGTVSCLIQPIEDNDFEMVKFLIENGVGRNLGGDMETDYDMSHAIYRNHVEMVKLLLESGYSAKGYDIWYANGEDSSSINTRLLSIIYDDKIDIARVILESGVNPNLLLYDYFNGNFNSYTVLEKTKSFSMRNLLKQYGAIESKDFSITDYKETGIGLNGKINETRVRFRDKPSLRGAHLGFFKKDEEVIAISSTEESMQIGDMNSPWYLVRRENGDMVWVYGHFVNVSRRFNSF